MVWRLLPPVAMRVLVWLCVIGCTSGHGSSASGQVPGGTFSIVDQISAVVTDGDSGTSDARIRLASTGGLCSDASATPPIDRKQQRFITIALRDVSGAMKTAPTAPGTYTIYPNTGSEPAKSASLETGAFDATCESVDADAGQGQSGTVALTSVTGGAFVGTFDVVLNTGGHITGSFDPEPCPGAAAALANLDQHSCM